VTDPHVSSSISAHWTSISIHRELIISTGGERRFNTTTINKRNRIPHPSVWGLDDDDVGVVSGGMTD
jgi:hypothetical protein